MVLSGKVSFPLQRQSPWAKVRHEVFMFVKREYELQQVEKRLIFKSVFCSYNPD